MREGITRGAGGKGADASKYNCQGCGYTCSRSHMKRNMISHLGHEAHEACLDLYSQSSYSREQDWARLARIGTGQKDPDDDQDVLGVGVGGSGGSGGGGAGKGVKGV